MLLQGVHACTHTCVDTGESVNGVLTEISLWYQLRDWVCLLDVPTLLWEFALAARVTFPSPRPPPDPCFLILWSTWFYFLIMLNSN